MQVLWSRAQAKASCRCGSCLHAAIARRTTTAASRRRLRVSDVFTACYSTILATAAFADAKVKEDRRKEWDRVIAEAKAGIPMNEPEYVEGAQPSPDSLGRRLSSVGMPSLEARGSLSHTHNAEATWGGKGWTVPPRTQETSLENKLRMLDSQLKEITLSPENSTGQEAVGITASDADPDNEGVDVPDGELPPREPKRKLHLEKMEQMVANLVDRLLLQTGIFSVQGSAALVRDDIQQEINDVTQRIQSLKAGFTRFPAYCWEDVESVEEQRYALHRSLTALCNGATASKSSIDLMLAKICYNLLISTAPPSISTYNILLSELSRLRQPQLAQIVVDSFLTESRFKANRETGRLILDHYRIKKDVSGFRVTTKQMGGHLKSLRIKRRHLKDLWIRSIQEWALTNKIILREGHLYQKMPRANAIFDSLIRGSLEMKGVRCAIRYVRAALREGFNVTSETLCTVIKACLTQLDFGAGISLLRAMLSWTESADFSTTFYSNEMRHHLYGLLSLCGISSSPNSQQNLPPKLPGDVLETMLRHMQIESITDSVGRFANRISSLERVFCVTETQSLMNLSNNDKSSSKHGEVKRALRLLWQMDREDKRRAVRKPRMAAAGRWIRILSLQSMLDVHATQITRRQTQLLPIIFARLSTEEKDEYVRSIRLLEQRGQVLRLSDRLELLSRLVRTQTVSSISEVELELHQSPGSIGTIRSQPDIIPKPESVKTPLAILKPQHSLLPMFPVTKPEFRAAAA
jgi:hypothetical protein